MKVLQNDIIPTIKVAIKGIIDIVIIVQTTLISAISSQTVNKQQGKKWTRRKSAINLIIIIYNVWERSQQTKIMGK